MKGSSRGRGAAEGVHGMSRARPALVPLLLLSVRFTLHLFFSLPPSQQDLIHRFAHLPYNTSYLEALSLTATAVSERGSAAIQGNGEQYV